MKRTNPQIVKSINILFIITLFYNFCQWGTYQTLSAKIIGIFICIYIFNDWLTTYSSFDLYSPILLVADIVVIFIFANLPSLLNNANTLWGYNIFIWLLLGFIELIYAIWDIIMKRLAPSEKVQKNLISWTISCFLSTFLCWSVFCYQLIVKINTSTTEFNQLILYGHIASIMPILYILIITIKWNLKRYKASKEKGSSFL